ncbi:hypothetical protein HN587_03835 [Candidatus Woesearchaeota archaeon]|jgi:hypothetical protein|nr:hypothetical protein [Candidatus Woesearchaeota archaeon]
MKRIYSTKGLTKLFDAEMQIWQADPLIAGGYVDARVKLVWGGRHKSVVGFKPIFLGYVHGSKRNVLEKYRIEFYSGTFDSNIAVSNDQPEASNLEFEGREVETDYRFSMLDLADDVDYGSSDWGVDCDVDEGVELVNIEDILSGFFEEIDLSESLDARFSMLDID